MAFARALTGEVCKFHFPIVIFSDLGGPIVSVSCADPYLSLLSESGQAAVITFKDSKLSITKTKIGISFIYSN